MQTEEPLLEEEEVMTLAVLAYLAGVAVHYFMPELEWLGGLFRGGEVEALLVLLLGSAMYYGYACTVVSLAYGVHTASLYAPLVKAVRLLDYLQVAAANTSSFEHQIQGAVPGQDVLVTSAAALALNLLICASAAAFGVHIHSRSRRITLALAVFAASAYLLEVLV